MDIEKIRKDFPLLQKEINNKKICYLDNAATTLKPQIVIDEISNYYANIGATVHRGVYSLSFLATDKYESTRLKVSKFINARTENEIVFTRGATESLNLIANGFLDKLNLGDEIIVSELAHHSLILPLQNIAKKTGAVIKYIPLTSDNRVSVDNFKKTISNKTKLVALAHISNVFGYITPIKEITKLAHDIGAKVIVDAAQSVPHMKVDVQDLDCDFLAFSGHKMCGPTGVGIVYGKYDLLQNTEPLCSGGTMSDVVTKESSTYKDAPYKFEAGTPMIASVIGLGTAVDYLNEIGMDNIYKRELELKRYLIDELSKVEGVSIFNSKTDTGIVTFNIADIHPHDATSIYDEENIALRAGHHCAQLSIKCLNQQSTLRASVYFYNTFEEIDKFIEATKKLLEFFSYE